MNPRASMILKNDHRARHCVFRTLRLTETRGSFQGSSGSIPRMGTTRNATSFSSLHQSTRRRERRRKQSTHNGRPRRRRRRRRRRVEPPRDINPLRARVLGTKLGNTNSPAYPMKPAATLDLRNSVRTRCPSNNFVVTSTESECVSWQRHSREMQRLRGNNLRYDAIFRICENLFQAG